MKIKNLSISLNRRPLFSNFSLELEPGSVAGFYAPTGFGKTTLFNFICGNLKNKKAFQISCDFISPQIKQAIVYQDFRLLENLTVKKNIVLPFEQYEKTDIQKFNDINEYCNCLLEKLCLVEKAGSTVKNLSGGEKQRVCIARAFLFAAFNECNVLILDEPFSNQDEEKNQAIIDLIKAQTKKGISVLAASHQKALLLQLTQNIYTQKDFIKGKPGLL